LLIAPHRRILALFGATPMAADDVPGFAAFVDHVAEVSAAPKPGLYRIVIAGGYWVNAVAVPHRREPAVVYSQPLLELLEPPEVRAVYAHEVAHLEQYQGRLLLWTRLQFWLLSALALLWVPASRMIGGFTWWCPSPGWR
jgi:Zn-dependent protease with chaperone function